MTLQEVRDRAEAIKRGEYERFAFDDRVNFHTAVALLSRAVCAIAWQPGYKEEALEILAELQAHGSRTYVCGNCGARLTEANIRRAVEESTLPESELDFYCPTYADQTGCLGYCKDDETKPAYWRTK